MWTVHQNLSSRPAGRPGKHSADTKISSCCMLITTPLATVPPRPSEGEVDKGQASQDLLRVVGRMMAAANPDLTLRLCQLPAIHVPCCGRLPPPLF